MSLWHLWREILCHPLTLLSDCSITQKTSEQNCFFYLDSSLPYPLCVFSTISSYFTDKMLLSTLCCNCRVHCDLRHGSCKWLCLGGLWNPHRANLTLAGVVLFHELSFHFYFSIFLALMVRIGKLRVASWIIKQRMNKKNFRGWFCLFCYLKNIWPMGWFFRGSIWVLRSGKHCLLPWHVSTDLLCSATFCVVWGRKSPAWISGFDHLCAFLMWANLFEKSGLCPDGRAH